MRPVVRGMCTYVQMFDGTLSLEDFDRMNEHIEIEHENTLRWQEAQKP